MLDFVPNHMALDHPWVESHPEYFVTGTEDGLAREPHNFIRVQRKRGDLILAYGRDPYFSGWPRALQLDYSNLSVAGSDINKIAQNCRPVRRCALRYGHAGPGLKYLKIPGVD